MIETTKFDKIKNSSNATNLYSNLFSSNICRSLVETIDCLLHVQTDDDLSYLLQHYIKKLMPHEISVCGIGDAKTLRVDFIINNGYPASFLSSIISDSNSGVLKKNTGVVKSPVVEAARLSTDGLVVVRDTATYRPDYELWTEAATKHYIKNMLAIQKRCSFNSQMSYFCFANFSGHDSPLHYRLLEILVSNLDAALHNIFNLKIKVHHPFGVTTREQEILNYLFQGLTNKHIAKQLGISQYTVKNHIHNILEKLNATNRVQALAIALSSGIIDHI